MMRVMTLPILGMTLLTQHMALASSQQPNVTVYSRYMRNQVLPCMCQVGDDLLIHWLKNDAVVHSYYDGKDQFDHQVLQFRGRTSLFHNELSKGNNSLLLKKVQVSDHGLYKCHTSHRSTGSQKAKVHDNMFVNVEVEAPVTKVSIVQEDGNITCSSEGIYPKPQVTWSRNKTGDTRIEPKEHQLYSIRSSVRVDDEGHYTCIISNTRSWRAATLTTAERSILNGSKDTLDCPALKPPLTSVTWRFNGEDMVQKDVKDLSTPRTLKLSPNLSGIYVCEVSNDEETRVKIINVTISETSQKESLWWIAILVIPIVAAVAVGLYFCVKHKYPTCCESLRSWSTTSYNVAKGEDL